MIAARYRFTDNEGANYGIAAVICMACSRWFLVVEESDNEPTWCPHCGGVFANFKPDMAPLAVGFLQAESIRLKRRVEDLEAFMRTRVKDECDCWHCRGFRAALSPQEKP